MLKVNAKHCLPVALLIGFCCSAQAATSVGSLTDSAGTPLAQLSNCTSSPCLQGVAYAVGYLAGCQVRKICMFTLCRLVATLVNSVLAPPSALYAYVRTYLRCRSLRLCLLGDRARLRVKLCIFTAKQV